jgi:hypothetical protein
MADTEKGGLSSIDPMADFSQKIQAQTTESQRVLDAHRKRLMDLISSRQQMPFDPSMMALAAGLLAPTKTGGFGESLGQGMSGYASEAEKQFRRQQEEAKLGYELEVAAQDQKRKMMGQQFFGELASRKKSTPAVSAEAPSAMPAAVTSQEAPAPAALETPTQTTAVRSSEAPAAPAVSKSPDQVLTQVNANDAQIKNLLKKIQSSGSDAFSDVSNEEIAMLGMYSPEYAKMVNDYRDAVNKGTTLDVQRLSAFVSQSKLELDKVQELRNQAEFQLKKREVDVKEASVPGDLPGVGEIKKPLSFWKEIDPLIESNDFNKLLAFYQRKQLPVNTIVDPKNGKVRFMTDNERNIKAKRDEARFTQKQEKYQIPEYGVGEFNLTPVQYDDYLTAKAQATQFKDPNILQHWFNSSPFSGFVVSGATIGTKLNSPELTNPPPAEAAPKPEAAAEPSAKREAPPAPADKSVVTEAAPAPKVVAGTTTVLPKAGSGKVLSAQDLERQMKAEEQQREFERLREEARLAEEKRKRESEARLQEAQPVEQSKETAKVNIQAEQKYSDVASEASNTFNTANRVSSLINDPRYSGAQGYFSKPNFTNAMVTFLDNGFKVGNWTIGFPAVGEALKKLGMSQDEVNAEAAILRDTGELSLKASKGLHQGAISDFERKLFGQISGSASTPLIAMKALMEFTKAQSVYDQQLYKEFQAWRDKNPSMIATRFVGSPEQKRAEGAYAKQLQSIQSVYFGTRSSAPSRSDGNAPSGGSRNADNKAKDKFK